MSSSPHSAQIVAILSDGALHTPDDLLAMIGADPLEFRAALNELELAGLPLLRDGLGRLSLTRAFVPLDPSAIKQGLLELGCRAEVEVKTIIDSTNAELLRRARNVAPAFDHRLSVLGAELQTAGRGRQGRGWSAQAGSSLTVSFARQLPRGLAGLGGLSLMCGLAVRDAALRLGVELQLKWPNDLIWKAQKLGGILIEAHPLGVAKCFVVIGIGINVAPDPKRSEFLLAQGSGSLKATDLISAGAASGLNRNRLIADLADTLTVRLDQFLSGGFGPFAAEWNAHHAFLDQAVEVIESGRVVATGSAREVDAEGRLCLETALGTISIIAGDISLRPATAFS